MSMNLQSSIPRLLVLDDFDEETSQALPKSIHSQENGLSSGLK